MMYKVYARSIMQDEWGSARSEHDDYDDAIEACDYWFEEGQYGVVEDQDGRIVYIDYYEPDYNHTLESVRQAQINFKDAFQL